MSAQSDDCCCLLTPKGRGAVATVVLYSQNLNALMGPLFAPANGRSFETNANRKIIYGTWTAGSEAHQKGEGLVVCPQSANTVEIHCHGGTAAVDNIVATLKSKDVALVEHAELRRRIIERANQISNANPPQAIQLELMEAVANATTNITAQHLLRLHNGFPEWFNSLFDEIESNKLSEAAELIRASLDHQAFGRRLTQTLSAVFCGEPNVGKSSLVNHLAGFERTIVHPTAGTTRDVISWKTAIAGWPVTFSDTAGLRSNAGTIEKEGIARARETISSADLVIAVIDASKLSANLFNATERPSLIVFNKIDLVDRGKIEGEGYDTDGVPSVSTSVTNGTGLEQLMHLLTELVVPPSHQLPEFIPICQRHSNWLRTLLTHCEDDAQKMALAHLWTEP